MSCYNCRCTIIMAMQYNVAFRTINEICINLHNHRDINIDIKHFPGFKKIDALKKERVNIFRFIDVALLHLLNNLYCAVKLSFNSNVQTWNMTYYGIKLGMLFLTKYILYYSWVISIRRYFIWIKWYCNNINPSSFKSREYICDRRSSDVNALTCF